MSTPPRLERSLTAGAVDKGVHGVTAVARGLADILSVIPYLLRKVMSLIMCALRYFAANIAQAVGVVVLMSLALIYIESVYHVRERVACVLQPSLCAVKREVSTELR
jgi:hypothetical protein